MRKYINSRKQQIKTKQTKQGRAEHEITYTTINRELALMRTMFNVLITAGKIHKNPVSLVTFFEEIQKDRILTPHKQLKILAVIDESGKRYWHLKDIVIIALNSAMRLGEILGMEKGWVNLREGIIVVPRQAMKRKKKDKRVPINSAIRPIIQRLMRKNRDSKFLIINPKTGKRFTSIDNSWNRVLKKAGINGKPGVDKLRFHDLRHTAATNLARAGKDMKFIAQYLGHADVRTTARYVHYSDEDLKDGAEILAQVPSDLTTSKIKSA
jgi:integrase